MSRRPSTPVAHTRRALRLLSGLAVALVLLVVGLLADVRPVYAVTSHGPSPLTAIAAAAVPSAEGTAPAPSGDGHASLHLRLDLTAVEYEPCIEDAPSDPEGGDAPTLRARDSAPARTRRSPRPREVLNDTSRASSRAAAPRGPPA